jgi:hypothetical protein
MPPSQFMNLDRTDMSHETVQAVLVEPLGFLVGVMVQRPHMILTRRCPIFQVGGFERCPANVVPKTVGFQIGFDPPRVPDFALNVSIAAGYEITKYRKTVRREIPRVLAISEWVRPFLNNLVASLGATFVAPGVRKRAGLA